jgi:thymidylate synthase ThyX
MSAYKHFEFSISDPDETDLVIVSVLDKRTGYWVRTALPNHGKQTASIMAFAGARYSRSDLSAHDLFKEIKDSGKNANEKLATIFRNYGHASVADMAMLFAYIENIPEYYAVTFFYETSIGGGQQRSTRYQDFSNSKIAELEEYLDKDRVDKEEYKQINKKFKKLQEDALSNYRKYVDILTQKYTKVYEVDTNDKRHTGALTARVFDSARYFLPNGTCLKTSLAWITPAREWARLISVFKSHKDRNLNYLGEQLEVLFAPETSFAEEFGYTPEAPDLIRHTSADETTESNLSELEKFLEENMHNPKFNKKFQFHEVSTELMDVKLSGASKVIVQNALSVLPTLDYKWFVKWLRKLEPEKRKELSRIIFNNFNHHKQMGNQFRVNEYSFVLNSSIAEIRDLNRHRAWGRFVPMLSLVSNYESMLNEGYTLPAYLYLNEKLSDVRQDFERDLLNYYSDLRRFIKLAQKYSWFPRYLVLQLLPFGHIMKSYFHASPKEISYMTKLRVRPGGHINYRILAYQIADEASKTEEFMQFIKLTDEEKPDATSSKEFLDRS